MRSSNRFRALPAETIEADANRQTVALAGLAALLALVVVSLFLVKTLHRQSALEDCVISGRTNCDVMIAIR
jgi:hypothetical protein